MHTPDPKASSAKLIAQVALKTLGAGGVASAQGTDKIAGNDAYWIAIKRGGQTMRIVGVDGPTRIVLLEHANGGQFAAYRNTFNNMQSGIKFTKYSFSLLLAGHRSWPSNLCGRQRDEPLGSARARAR